jgi:hypothetical protein
VASDVRIGGKTVGEPKRERPRDRASARTWFASLFVVSLAVAGLVLYLLFPHAAAHAAAEIRRRPGLDAALGFGVLVLTPFAVVLMFITGVGWLLGVVLLLAYLAALATAGLIGAYAVGDMALAASGKGSAGKGLRALTLVGVLVLAAALQWVPVVGWLLALLLLLWGLGAIAQLIFGTAPSAAEAGSLRPQ